MEWRDGRDVYTLTSLDTAVGSFISEPMAYALVAEALQEEGRNPLEMFSTRPMIVHLTTGKYLNLKKATLYDFLDEAMRDMGE